MVNRLWEQLFGNGIVETVEDMGTQGAEPTHRELLDYLAYRFMNDHGWSIKKLLKEMVLSATYRQESKITKEALEKDPVNKYYGRGSRVRLSAEQVRDQALFISGLLSKKMYGASVMPWQPEGIWMSPYNGDSWKVSDGSWNGVTTPLHDSPCHTSSSSAIDAKRTANPPATAGAPRARRGPRVFGVETGCPIPAIAASGASAAGTGGRR